MKRRLLNDTRKFIILVDELMKLTMKRDGTYEYDYKNVHSTMYSNIYLFNFKSDEKEVEVRFDASKNPRVVIDGKVHVVPWPYEFEWRDEKFYIRTKDGEVGL